MTAAQRRLNALKALLTHVRERLQIDLGFALWDGSTIPLDLPAGRIIQVDLELILRPGQGDREMNLPLG